MSGNPWHRRYHSDALAGMLSLSLEERGAYQTVLDLIYDRGGPIADNERLLAGYMGCSIRKWRSLRQALIDQGKLVLANGLLSNSRAEKEIENDAKTRRKLAENGSKGGHKRAENAKNDNENRETELAALQQGSSLRARSRSQKPDIPLDKSNGAFDPEKLMFDSGVKLLREAGRSEVQARSIIGKWKRDHGVEAVIAGIGEAVRQGIAEPVSWLEARWAIRNADPWNGLTGGPC